MITPLRVAIVGCGRMGTERASNVPSAGGSIVACVDNDIRRAQDLSLRYPNSLSLRSVEQLNWGEVDAVFLCTPPAIRLDIVQRACDAGTAVFVEKPLGLNSDESRMLCDIVTRRPVINAVGYMNRYRTGFTHARNVLSKTKLIAVVAVWAGKRYGVPWWEDDKLSGGPFNEQATHLVDCCRYIGGEFTAVCARATSSEDSVAAAVRFDNGALGTLLYTCEVVDKWISIQLISARGFMRFDGWDFRLTENSIDGQQFDANDDVFSMEVRDFIHAVLKGTGALIRCDFADAHKTQVAVDRIRRAIREQS